MNDQDKTKKQLIAELVELRQRVAATDGILDVQLDRTERNRAEDELARNRAVLQATIESLPFDFFALGLDGRYFLQNAHSKLHWGDAIGKHPEELGVDRAILAIWLDNNRRALAGDIVEGDVEFSTHGERRFFHNRLAPIREGDRICGILGVNVDITDRKRVEEKLREAHGQLEQRVRERTAELREANECLQAEVKQRREAEEKLAIFRRFVEAATQGFGMADMDGQFTYVNPFLARLFGVQSPEDVIGRHVSVFHPAEYLECREKEMLPALRRGEYWRGEQLLLFPDGQLHPTLHTVFPVRDEHGELWRTAAVITDITELKRAEEMLRRQNDLLRRALLANDHERRTIAYEIHDSYLQQVAGAAMQFEACEQYRKKRRRKAAAGAFEDGMKILRESQTEARRLIRGVRPLALDQSSVVVAIGQFVRGFDNKPGPQIEWHCQVEFDRLQSQEENAIYRIVQEGVTNARKHGQSAKIRVELVQRGDRIRILVQDWGSGFDPEKIGQYCFGLESIRERAKMLGGEANIDTVPNQGTRITVELPLLVRDEDD